MVQRSMTPGSTGAGTARSAGSFSVKPALAVAAAGDDGELRHGLIPMLHSMLHPSTGPGMPANADGLLHR
jgi:hypothetical protein